MSGFSVRVYISFGIFYRELPTAILISSIRHVRFASELINIGIEMGSFVHINRHNVTVNLLHNIPSFARPGSAKPY